MRSADAGLALEDPVIGGRYYNTEEWQLACRIAASKGLSKSELLQRFLLYICELSLSGRADEITEQRIGTQIFHRPADYNPAEDNIVRSYARTMRKRIEEYFAGEGQDEPLRLSIPRGGYVPVFEAAAVAAPIASDDAALSEAEPEGNESPATQADVVREKQNAPITERTKTIWFTSLWIGLAGIILGAVVAAVALLSWVSAKKEREQSVAHAVWLQIFRPNRNTLIVPADSGLGILENLSKRSITVEQYANGSYLAAMAAPAGVDERNFNDIGRQRYTSVVDLNIAARLLTLPEFLPARTQVRYARSVTAEDLRDSNAILIGSKHTNPWVALFEKSMNFTLEYTSVVDDSFILNHGPQAGEQKLYRNGASETSNQTYGVIAYLPSLDGNGHVLVVEGLNMAATQAAAEVLFNEKAIGPVLQAARLADGSLRPFELLVATNSIGAASSDGQIVAMRIHPSST